MNTANLSPAWREAITFGVLWGAVEVTIGTFAHAIRLPIGFVLTVVGVMILTVGRSVFPRRGFCIRAGLICACIRGLVPTGLVITPLIAILVESLIAELCFLIPVTLIASPLAGVLGVCWTISQKIIIKVIMYGEDIIRLYISAFEKIVRAFGWTQEIGLAAIGLVLGIHLLIAAGFATAAVFLGRNVARQYWEGTGGRK